MSRRMSERWLKLGQGTYIEQNDQKNTDKHLNRNEPSRTFQAESNSTKNNQTETMGLITFIFSMVVYPNIAFMSNWDDKYWVPYSAAMGFIIPFITLFVDKITNYTKQKNVEKDFS